MAPEALNLASLWKLPVLFLCENNGKYGAGRATSAAQSSTMAAFPLTDLPKAYKVPAQQIDGLDSGTVHATISAAVEKIRRGEGPQFIEAPGDRPLARQRNQLAGCSAEHGQLARLERERQDTEKVREWYRSCDPLLIFIRELVEQKQATKEEIADIEKKVKAEIADAVEFAVASPYPKPEEAAKEYFA